MEIKIEQGSIESSAADTLIVNLFEGCLLYTSGACCWAGWPAYRGRMW